MKYNELQRYFRENLGWGVDGSANTVFEFLLNVRSKARGGVLLDAGAGFQRYKPFFEDSLYLAQEHPIAGGLNKHITNYDILCDVKLIPLKDNSVDCVLSTSALEHYEYPEEFFMEAFRVLKPGGILFISVPFTYPEHEVPYDFQRPTRYGLKRWYSVAGFVNVDVKPTSSSIHASTVFIKDAALVEGAVGIRKALKNSPLTSIRILPRYIVYYLLVKPSIWLLKKTVINIPNENTLFPTGWVSEGAKPFMDSADEFEFKSKEDFLQKRMLGEVGFEIKDGVIVASEKL